LTSCPRCSRVSHRCRGPSAIEHGHKLAARAGLRRRGEGAVATPWQGCIPSQGRRVQGLTGSATQEEVRRESLLLSPRPTQIRRQPDRPPILGGGSPGRCGHGWQVGWRQRESRAEHACMVRVAVYQRTLMKRSYKPLTSRRRRWGGCGAGERRHHSCPGVGTAPPPHAQSMHRACTEHAQVAARLSMSPEAAIPEPPEESMPVQGSTSKEHRPVPCAGGGVAGRVQAQTTPLVCHLLSCSPLVGLRQVCR